MTIAKFRSLIVYCFTAAIGLCSGEVQAQQEENPSISSIGSIIKSDASEIVISFPHDVRTSIQAGHLKLVNIDGGFTVPESSYALSFFEDGNAASFQFPGIASKLLPEGNYMAIMQSEAWTGVPSAGTCTTDSALPPDRVFPFHVFFGDVDGDRDVDFLDASHMRNAWNRRSGEIGYNNLIDFSADGKVGEADRSILLRNYFKILPPKLGIYVQLKNDTGFSHRDNLTRDPSLVGTVIGRQLLHRFESRFATGPWMDITSMLDGENNFVLPRETVEIIKGGSLNQGTQTVEFRAVDSAGAILYATAISFDLHTADNCPPRFISQPVTSADTKIIVDPAPVDLTRWTVVPFEGTPEWVLEDNNQTARQRVNITGSALLSDVDITGSTIRGTLRVDGFSDDDYIGFVFGYQNDQQFYLFDWKWLSQWSHDGWDVGIAEYGMSIKRVDARTSVRDLWDTAGTANVKQLYHNWIPWANRTDYEFALTFIPGDIQIVISQGSTVIADIHVNDSTYGNGRFGFYNLSQENVVYKSFRRENVPVQTYSYQSEAIDGNGNTLTYSLVNGPNGMAINPSTGLLTWAPLQNQQGQHPVTIRVTDGQGGTDEQSFTVNVLGFDSAPTISLSASNVIVDQGLNVTFKVAAQDDLRVANIALTIDDEPVALDGNGDAVVHATRVGYMRAVATATDSGGNTSTSNLQIRVRPPGESIPPGPGNGTIAGPGGSAGTGTGPAPIARIDAPTNPDDDLSKFIGTIDANTGTLSHWSLAYAPRSTVNLNDLTDPAVNWTSLAHGTTAQSKALLATLDLGSIPNTTFVFRLLAYNTNGKGTVTSVIFNPLDTSVPTVSINSPAPESSLIYLTQIRGTVDANGGTLQSWALDYAPADLVDMQDLGAGAAWIRIGTGTTIQNNAILGTLDTTMLRNGSYIVRLLAFNDNGRGFAIPAVYHVTGDAKLGNFRLDFTDLQIPLAGIPITITRSYDSLEAGRSSDFGYGWKLAISDSDIRETTPDIGGFFSSNPYRAGTRVYITTPEGRRVGFTFQPEFAAGSLLGSAYRAKFVPDPGVYEKLSVPEGDQGFLSIGTDGTARLFLIGFGWNPDEFLVTRPDGTSYRYTQTEGLKTVVAPSGNTLTYTRDGITHTSGASIRFIRDQQGRIAEIRDPAGKSISYAYNAAGELVGVKDREGAETTFTYRQTPAHYLEDVIDSLGRRAQRTEYGPDGRVLAVIDAAGNRFEQNFDPRNFTGTRTDGRGNVTTLVYNARGNLLEEHKPEGGITRWEYNDPANPDKETAKIDPLNNRTVFTFDSRGNKLTETDPMGTVTSYAYNTLNKLTSLRRTSADGTSETSESAEYDDAGNLTRLIDGLGNHRDFVYDVQSRLVSSTDFEGHQTIYDYTAGCPCGSPSKISYPDGSIKLLEYNSLGQVTKVTDEVGAITLFGYDANGRKVTETDHDGNVTRFEYDANGNQVKHTDRLGRIAKFVYNEKNRLVQEIKLLTNDNDDTNDVILNYEYDADNHLTAIIDPDGNRTEFFFDRDGRMNRRKDAAGASSIVSYDLAGNTASITNRNGQKRSFQHNGRNQATAELWHKPDDSILRTIAIVHDGLGRQTSLSDPDSTYTWKHDANNRVTEVSNQGTPGVPTVILRHTHDKDGHPTSTTDNAGVSVTTTFDVRGKSDHFIWSGGGIAPASVDINRNGCGQLTSITRYNAVNLTGMVSQTVHDQIAPQGWTKRIQHRGQTGSVYDSGTVFTYGYNAEGEVTSQSSQGNSTAYTYDPTGQLTSATHSSPAYPDESYTYSKGGNRLNSHLHAVYTTGVANRLQSDGVFSYSYDAEGNLITQTEIATSKVTEFGYDHRGRTTAITERTSAGGAILNQQSFTFDVLDRRITVNSGGTITHIVYNGENAWADYKQDGTTAARYLFADRIDANLAKWTVSGTQWYLTDKLGSIRGLADSSGSLTNSVAYDSFGKTIAGSGIFTTERFGFTGREVVSNNLMHYRSRLYNAGIGRFAAEDRIDFNDRDWNLYRYVSHNPLTLTDPTGKSSLSEYAIANLMVLEGMALSATQYAVCTVIVGDEITIDGVANAARIGAIEAVGFGFAGALTKATIGLSIQPVINAKDALTFGSAIFLLNGCDGIDLSNTIK